MAVFDGSCLAHRGVCVHACVFQGTEGKKMVNHHPTERCIKLNFYPRLRKVNVLGTLWESKMGLTVWLQKESFHRFVCFSKSYHRTNVGRRWAQRAGTGASS